MLIKPFTGLLLLYHSLEPGAVIILPVTNAAVQKGSGYPSKKRPDTLFLPARKGLERQLSTGHQAAPRLVLRQSAVCIFPMHGLIYKQKEGEKEKCLHNYEIG